MEKGDYLVVANTSSLMEFMFTDTDVRKVLRTHGAKNVAINTTYRIQYYTYFDYKFLILDNAITLCNVTDTTISFILRNITKDVFEIVTFTLAFCRILKDKCKKTNVFG